MEMAVIIINIHKVGEIIEIVIDNLTEVVQDDEDKVVPVEKVENEVN